jgi:hypothetical protein
MEIKKLTLSIALISQAISPNLFAADQGRLDDRSSLAAENLSCGTRTVAIGYSIQSQYEAKFPGMIMGDLQSSAVGSSTGENAKAWIAVWKRAIYPNFLYCQDFVARVRYQTRYGEVVRYSKALGTWTAGVELISYLDSRPVGLVRENANLAPCTVSPNDAKLILINRTAQLSSALCAEGDATNSSCRDDLIARKILAPLSSCTFQAPVNGSFVSFDQP